MQGMPQAEVRKVTPAGILRDDDHLQDAPPTEISYAAGCFCSFRLLLFATRPATALPQRAQPKYSLTQSVRHLLQTASTAITHAVGCMQVTDSDPESNHAQRSGLRRYMAMIRSFQSICIYCSVSLEPSDCLFFEMKTLIWYLPNGYRIACLR